MLSDVWTVSKVERNLKKGRYYIHLGCGSPIVVDCGEIEQIMNVFNCSKADDIAGQTFPRVSGSRRRDFQSYVEGTTVEGATT